MTEDLIPSDAIAAAVAAADGYFAAAVCRIIAEGRDAGKLDPEWLALEIEFALRGCYAQGDPVTGDAMRERAATLLDAAGGPTKLEVDFGVPMTGMKTMRFG